MNFRASAKSTPLNIASLMAKIVPRIVAAQQEGAAAVAGEAKAIVPVSSGALQDSIGVGPTEIVGTKVSTAVVATAPHAGFVEFGTGLRGEGTYPGELPTSGVPFTGSWDYDFRQQNWQGHAAQPFLRPALDTSRGAILAAYASRGFKV